MRRRILVAIMSALLLPLALAACGTKRAGLPPEEVMERAARASQELLSAVYDLSGDFSLASGGSTVAQGQATVEGRLQEGGSQIQFALEGTLTLPESGPAAISGKLEVIAAGEQVYLKIHELRDDPPGGILQEEILRGALGQWWLLPAPGGGTGATAASAVTPHPRLLQAQTQVVRVTEDRGIEELRGRDAYHYDVVIDPGKLVAYLREVARERGEDVPEEAYAPLAEIKARGELWIDAESFLAQALRRAIDAFPLPDGRLLRLSFFGNLRDHNAAAAIALPADANPFSQVVLPPLPGVMPSLEEEE